MASPPSNNHHVLVIPFPQHSHTHALLQFALKLSSHGFLTTLLLPPHLHTLFLHQHPHPPPPTFHLLPLHQDAALLPPPPPPQQLADFPAWSQTAASMRHGVEAFVQDSLHRRPVTLLLADVFVTWSKDLASKFDIPRIAFFPSNASNCSIRYHVPDLITNGILPFRDEQNNFVAKDVVDCIPGVLPLNPVDFPTLMTSNASRPQFQIVLKQAENLRTASGIVLNTFEELESESVAVLKKEVPLYAVGPFHLLCENGGGRTSPEVECGQEREDCLRWLDTREKSSVLYVSFGSAASFPVSHLKELALGLMASQQPFLWVIRPDSHEGPLSDNLPEDFLSRTKDLGLIISWAPQLSVLAHPAVGGFVSHCGWNSIIENLSVGGVPMICWPRFAEQSVNCRISVDQWKIAMEFHRRHGDGMVEKEEVERVVRAVMEGQEGEMLKNRAAELRDAGRKAVVEGGSSYMNFERFIKDYLCSTSSP